MAGRDTRQAAPWWETARPPIPLSANDLERCRLESAINDDLGSLSLSSLHTLNSESNKREDLARAFHDDIPHIPGRSDKLIDVPGFSDNEGQNDQTFLSSSSSMTVEYARAFGQGTSMIDQNQFNQYFQQRKSSFPDPPAKGDYLHPDRAIGPTGTPRASVHNRKPSGMSGTSVAESPVSTAGHHVSAMTLADGVFRRKGAQGGWSDDGSEFDPERSLGRLVGELGRVMGEKSFSPRPTSPFATARSPPRSPSPLPFYDGQKQHMGHNDLSFTLNRANPLPSPPHSGSGDEGTTITNPHRSMRSGTGFTAAARRPDKDIRAGNRQGTKNSKLPLPIQPRRALSDSTVHNVHHPATPGPGKKSKTAVASLMGDAGNGRKAHSAPAGRRRDVSADVTGMTGLMETPAKGGAFGGLDKNGGDGGDSGAAIPQTLATLQARLRGLETENSLARRRVRELERELELAKTEVDAERHQGGSRLKEAIGEKTVLEALIQSLRDHLTRLTQELEDNKALVMQLREKQEHLLTARNRLAGEGSDTANELAALRREIERLSAEVARLSGIIEKGLETRKVAREERAEQSRNLNVAPITQTHTARSAGNNAPVTEGEDREETRLPSKLRQGLHASASTSPTLMPPSAQPATRIALSRSHAATHHTHPPHQEPRTSRRQSQRAAPPTPPDSDDQSSTPSHSKSHRSSGHRSQRERVDGPESPFPSIRAEDEAEFFAALERPNSRSSTGKTGKSRAEKASSHGGKGVSSVPTGVPRWDPHSGAGKGRHGETAMPGLPPGLPEGVVRFMNGTVPPQTVLSRIIRELEDDFVHYKAIYAELADQYKLLDAASVAAKRHILAEHLKEVIGVLEQKADQIEALYQLLHFQDQPDLQSSGDAAKTSSARRSTSVGDVMRMVRETLGEDAMRSLQSEVGIRTRRKGGYVL